MEFAKNLKLIVRAGAGFDNIDCKTASEKSIVAMNTPGMNSNAVAELAFGMLVQHCRNSFDGSSGRELRGRIGFGWMWSCQRPDDQNREGFRCRCFRRRSVLET
jgi:hypothetical protein